MINPRELLEDLEMDGTRTVIIKLINIIEELENRLNERDMLDKENAIDIEMKFDADLRYIGELTKDIENIKEKLAKLNTKTDTI